MSDPIILPPLPEPVNKHGFNCIQTLDQLRARDLEVARLVLKAAAQAAQPDDSYRDEWFCAKADAVKRIRALQVRHHE